MRATVYKPLFEIEPLNLHNTFNHKKDPTPIMNRFIIGTENDENQDRTKTFQSKA